MTKSFVMFIMLSLSSGNFINEIDKIVSFFRCPDFWVKSICGSIAAFACWNLCSWNSINKLSKNRNCSIEVDDEWCTNEWNWVCEELNLPFCFGSYISISNCACSHNQSVENKVIFSKRTLWITYCPNFVSKKNETQE